MPNLYIIAGCNGAGKTTSALTILPEILSCREFVNADAIAVGLSPFDPESVAIEAGKLMLGRIDNLMKINADFAIETTLSSKGYKSLIQRAKEKNYKVTLLFFWLNSSELAIKRVSSRVAKGGHNIPIDTIKRRYTRGIQNFMSVYKQEVDNWLLLDNSESESTIIADSYNQKEQIFDIKLWNNFKSIINEKSIKS
jgi:predicted ABC-type ATPase